MKSLDRITLDPPSWAVRRAFGDAGHGGHGRGSPDGRTLALAEILEAYPYLEREDIDQSLAYAAWSCRNAKSALSIMRPPLS